jgi:NAD(P)-dependent dehydrogenase (short-subunit alcohol dehydrogenase family)
VPTVVITGASQGIGRAVAERFAREADTRIALLARNEAKLRDVADVCISLGAEAETCPVDVTDEHAVFEVARHVERLWGGPDVLVNNAGTFEPGSVEELTIQGFRSQLETNVVSAFAVTKAFLPAMVERGDGSVFFMGSVASIRAYPGSAGYCASKHALLGLARVVREETKQSGIRVTTLLPGATLTPSWDGVDLPASRFMPASDVAEALFTCYSLSDRSVVEEILVRPQEGDI